MRKTINKSTTELPISLDQKPAEPLQNLSQNPSEYDHVYVRAFSGVEFIILISVIILCLFYRFGLALAVLLGGLLFYQKVGIRDPKTGQSWVVARKNGTNTVAIITLTGNGGVSRAERRRLRRRSRNGKPNNS